MLNLYTWLVLSGIFYVVLNTPTETGEKGKYVQNATDNATNATDNATAKLNTAFTKVLNNITRLVPDSNGIDTQYTICPAHSWINSIEFKIGKKNTVVGFSVRCSKGVDDKDHTEAQKPMPQPEHNGKPINLTCDSQLGSFAMGIMAKLKNRSKKKYELSMAADVKLVCGGMAIVDEPKNYGWKLACATSTAMCGMQLKIQVIDNIPYTVGLTIGCCSVVPESLIFSASTLVLVKFDPNPPPDTTMEDILFGSARASTSQTALITDGFIKAACLGGDYLHQLRYSKENTMQFECGTLITRVNKYPLLDIYKMAFPSEVPSYTKEGERVVTCLKGSIMVGINVAERRQLEWGTHQEEIKAELQKDWDERDKEAMENSDEDERKPLSEFTKNFELEAKLRDKYKSKKYAMNPICRPNHTLLSNIDGDKLNLPHPVKESICPGGHAMCGIAGKKDGSPKDLSILCCPVEFGLCESSPSTEQLSTEHCNVINADSVCTIQFMIGEESTQTTTKEESEKGKMKAEVKAEVEAEASAKGALMVEAKGNIAAELKAAVQAQAKASARAAAGAKVEAAARALHAASVRAKAIADSKMEFTQKLKLAAENKASEALKALEKAGEPESAGSLTNKDKFSIEKALKYSREKALALATAETAVYAEMEADAAVQKEGRVAATLKLTNSAKVAAEAEVNGALSLEGKLSLEISAKAEASIEASAKVKLEAGAAFQQEESKTTKSSKSATQSNSKTVTASFHVRKGGQLLAFQRVSSCGGTKIRSDSIINFVVPTNICEARDELIEIFPSMSIRYSREDWMLGWHANFSGLRGFGLRWNKRPKQLGEGIEYGFDELKKKLPENFYENPKLTPSPVTGFNWASWDIVSGENQIWNEYKPTPVWDDVTVKVKTVNVKFYRIIGKCGDDWTVAVKKVIAKEYFDEEETNATENAVETSM